MAGPLKDLGNREREAVLRWAEVMARRFAHIPMTGLRSLAAEVGAPAVRAFLRGSGEELYADFVAFADHNVDALPNVVEEREA